MFPIRLLPCTTFNHGNTTVQNWVLNHYVGHCPLSVLLVLLISVVLFSKGASINNPQLFFSRLEMWNSFQLSLGILHYFLCFLLCAFFLCGSMCILFFSICIFFLSLQPYKQGGKFSYEQGTPLNILLLFWVLASENIGLIGLTLLAFVEHEKLQ